MNQDPRQDDRPRLASFLIDDILAPQAVPVVVQCSPSQSSQAMAQANLRQLSASGVRDSSVLRNQPTTSTCLPFYGNSYHVYVLVSIRIVCNNFLAGGPG